MHADFRKYDFHLAVETVYLIASCRGRLFYFDKYLSYLVFMHVLETKEHKYLALGLFSLSQAL